VHITFVRSVDMDKWKYDELAAMKNGGNGAAGDFFKTHGWDSSSREKIPEKYQSRAASLYKLKLNAEIAANPIKPNIPIEDLTAAADSIISDLSASTSALTVDNSPTTSSAAPLPITAASTIPTPLLPTTSGSANLGSNLGAPIPLEEAAPRSAVTLIKPTKAIAGKGGAKKLGAVKIEGDIKFDMTPAAPTKVTAPSSITTGVSPYTASASAPIHNSTYESDEALARRLQEEDDARYATSLASSGMGGSSTARGSSGSYHTAPPAHLAPASERFAGAKAISSDQYFERNKMNEKELKEHQARVSI
jgi:ADP-ribosylation factor GTPase-activating protein 2/3